MHKHCLPYERALPVPPDLVDVAQIMAMTGLSRSDVYRRVQHGDFGPVWRLGQYKGVRVSAGSVEAWLEGRVRVMGHD